MSSFANPNFETYNNNYGGVDITEYWGPSSGIFKKDSNGNGLFYCTSNNSPYASFENLEDSIDFFVQRWKNRFNASQFASDEPELYAKFIFLNSVPNNSEENIWDTLSDVQKNNLISEYNDALNLAIQI
jgi:hypothetical protein